jgi:hypothetical protein
LAGPGIYTVGLLGYGELGHAAIGGGAELEVAPQWGGKVIRGYAEFERQFMNWVWSQACGLCTDLPPGMR